MAQRTVCLCDGKYIGIESIFTVIDGKQINIPEKLKELRVKSHNNELFCPCGCGANLILVAGDRNLREQHFRLKDSSYENDCHVITEGKISVASKIVLKCWLEDKLGTGDIETRVPISLISDTERKYEFSFLSRAKKIGVNYCYERINLSDEKFDVLKANSDGIHLIYIVDVLNGGSNGQYPEALMKVQNRQGYCLFLDVEDALYNNAKLYATFYVQDNNGLWKEIIFADGLLSDYSVEEKGQLQFKGELLSTLQEKRATAFELMMREERARREEEKRWRAEREKQLREEGERKRLELRKQKEEEERQRQQKHEAIKKRMQKEEEERQAEIRRRDEDFKRNMAENFSQQQTMVIDAEGERWIKCEYCGVIAKEKEFVKFGGINRVNLGTCKTCMSNNETKRASATDTTEKENKPMSIGYDSSICPECGGKLREKNGRYGAFIGCSNYPKCRHTWPIRKDSGRA